MPPIFFSPLLFKKTQIQLHSLKTTTLKINLSLFNIISVHFHHVGPPFNKGMYSSPVKSSRRPACHSAFRQPTLFVLQFLYSDEPIAVLTSTVASPYRFFSLSFMRMGISPSAVKNSITERNKEYKALLKGGPKLWKRTEIILKSDKLTVNLVVFKLCNCIWVFLQS